MTQGSKYLLTSTSYNTIDGRKGQKFIEITLTIQYNNRLHGNCALFAQFHYLRKKRCDCLLKNRSETAVAKG